MPFLDEIVAKLVTAGVGTLGTQAGVANSIYATQKAIIPAGNGPYLIIIETGGSGPARTQDSPRSRQRPTAQITTRAVSSPLARAMAKAAYDALDGLFNVTLSGTFYLSVTARQEPTDVGVDDAERAMVAFNIDAEKSPS